MKFDVNPNFFYFFLASNASPTPGRPLTILNTRPSLIVRQSFLFAALHHLPVCCGRSRQSCPSGCSEVAHDKDAELVLCDKDGWTGDVDLVALLLEMLPNHSLIFAPLRFLRLDGGVSVMRCSFSRGVGVCTECFRIVVWTLLMRSCSLSSELSGGGF